jgi:hypothetical protein
MIASMIERIVGLPWWLRYGAATVAGGAIVYFAYAVPRIATMEAEAAKASLQAAEEKSAFLMGARDEQRRLQGLADAATAGANADRVALDRVRASGHDSDVRLRNAERALQDHLARLPEASGCPAIVSAARALGDVEQRVEEFGGRCSAEADRLGIEVRRLEATCH